MDTAPTQDQKTYSLAALGVIAFFFILPLFVIPSGAVPFQFSKVTFVLAAAVLLLLFFIFRILREGSVSVVWSPLVISLAVLPLSYLVASVFSPSPLLSLFGYQLEFDTFGLMLLGSALALTIVASTPARRTVFTALLALLAGAGVVFLFQLVQLFFNAPFAVAGFKDVTANLVGTWTDFGLFAGLVSSLILLALTALPLSTLHRAVMLVMLVVSLFFLTISAVTEAWILTGIVAFLTLTYVLARRYLHLKQGEGDSTLAMSASLVVFIAAIFFLFVGSGLATSTQNLFGVNTLEVRPSVQGTVTVLENVFQKSLFVGSGPNTFLNEWLLYRPAGVLGTPFWNVEFTVGSGAILTALITGGVVVGLAWLFFIGALFYTTVRSLYLAPVAGDRSYFLIVATGVASLYLLAVHVLHAPGATLSLILFAMVGLFIASISGTPLIHSRTISFASSPRVGFAVVLCAIVIAIGSLAFAYTVGRVYASAVFYQQAINASRVANIDGAEASLGRAIAAAPQDRYYRALGLTHLARMNAIVQSGSTDAAARDAFQKALAGAIENTTRAVTLNPAGFDNVFARSAVYAATVPLGIDGAYENAVLTLGAARVLNPTGPDVDLRLAQVEYAQGNTEAARNALASALGKKQDYTDAILTLAQIELTAGNLKKAIDSVKAAVYFEPQNPLLLYQLGVLLLEDRSYDEATAAFGAALSAEPQFQNAQFFLAQAYAFLGRYGDAARLMQDLVQKNPDNGLVKTYAAALSENKNPFSSGVVPPAETAPTPAGSGR